jgi:formylglycine-generating enzyme required for sulfatase activity
MTQGNRAFKIRLHRILDGRFDDEELKTLCMFLDVEYDDLRGEGQEAKARELIKYLERRGQLSRLVEVGQELRPEIKWPVVPETVHEPTPPVSPPESSQRQIAGAETRPRVAARQPFEPEMVPIPAGEFLMGSDPTRDQGVRNDEQPQHRLYLPDYRIARTPVTNAQYLAFVQAAGRAPPVHWVGGRPPQGKEDHPVVYVNCYEALVYCLWLAQVTGVPYTLPSEAEWEKAAGWDAASGRKRIYPWGDEWDATRCNSAESGGGGTTAVDAYPQGASPYGVLDMAGNVWEWTRSLYVGYLYNPMDGRENLNAVGFRVVRGGSFAVDRSGARCALRGMVLPNGSWINFGLRVCVVV